MTSTADVAGFAADVEYDRLPTDVREAVKRRLLDVIGVGLRNRNAPQADAVRRGLTSEGTTAEGGSRLWGSDTTALAPRAAMGNAVSIASGNGPTFLSPTLAPSGGSTAAVVAASETRGITGEGTIAGLAAALEVHGECAWNAPLDDLHPATQTGIAAAAGAGRTMGLDAETLTDAIGIVASRLTLSVGESTDPVPTGSAARCGLQACLLADGGVQAPDTLSAPNGWHDRLGPFELDFDPGCERVRDAAILPYDGHPYEQPAIQAAIELATEVPLDPAEIESVTVETFDAAARTIDPFRIAAALVDRELPVYSGARTDLEPIAGSVTVSADGELTDQRAQEIFPVRLTVEYRDGTVFQRDIEEFDGNPRTPASWGTVEKKFHAIVDGTYGRDRRETIVETVRAFEAENAAELARLLR